MTDPVIVQPQPTNPTPINPTPVPVTPAPAAQKTSLGVYDLPLFGPASAQGAGAIITSDGTLRFEPQGASFIDVDTFPTSFPDFAGSPAMRFVSSRVRVTNTGTTTIDHLTLLPAITVSQDGSAPGTVGATPFKGLTNQDGTDASGRAAELVTGQASVLETGNSYDASPAPAVRPDADASLYVQDFDVTNLSAKAPAGVRIGQIQSQGWRLSTPLAPGQSAMMTLGTSIPRIRGSALPANYALSVVAVNDPSPSINPLNVKIDLTQAANPQYQFPDWKPNGEAVYMIPEFGTSNGQRMLTLAKVQADATATFNLPTKTAVTPFLIPLLSDLSNCTAINKKLSDSAAQSMDAGFVLAEDFTEKGLGGKPRDLSLGWIAQPPGRAGC